MNVVYDEVLDSKAEATIEPEDFVITPIVNKAKKQLKKYKKSKSHFHSIYL